MIFYEMFLVWGCRRAPRVTRRKVTESSGEACPSFQSSVEVMVTGHTKPPRLGPSCVSTTGMSPAAHQQLHMASACFSRCCCMWVAHGERPPKAALPSSTLGGIDQHQAARSEATGAFMRLYAVDEADCMSSDARQCNSRLSLCCNRGNAATCSGDEAASTGN